MPAPYARAGLFWYVFFRHAPPRYAVVRTPDQAQRRDQQYDEQHSVVTNALIARHHAGEIASVTPTALDGRVRRSPLDSDAGTLNAYLIGYPLRSRWAFGQPILRPGLTESKQHRYVRLPLDHIANQSSLPQPGTDRIAIAGQPGMRDCCLIRLDRNAAFRVSSIRTGFDSNAA